MKALSRFRFLSLAASGLLLASFGTAALAQSATDKPLKVGVSAGPYGDILREAARLSEKQGLKAEIIEFTDWNQPNAALDAGDIDLNNFQHKFYLANQSKARNYKLAGLDDSILVPGGIHSKKYAKAADIPNGAKIAIPNDPTNAGRALLLFEKTGLIKLKPDVGIKATVQDVVENPKKLQILEIDAAQLPRSLDDVAAAFVSSNYAYLAGLDLNKALIPRHPTPRRSPTSRCCSPRARTARTIRGSGIHRDLPLAAGEGFHRQQVQRLDPGRVVNPRGQPPSHRARLQAGHGVFIIFRMAPWANVIPSGSID